MPKFPHRTPQVLGRDEIEYGRDLDLRLRLVMATVVAVASGGRDGDGRPIEWSREWLQKVPKKLEAIAVWAREHYPGKAE